MINFDKGLELYSKNEYRLAKDYFDDKEIMSLTYLCLSKIAINEFDDIVLKNIDQIFKNNKKLIFSEFLYFLKNRNVEFFNIENTECYKEIFKNISLCETFIKKLSFFVDINEITYNEKLISSLYKEEKYIFSSLFFFSKKYSDLEFNNLTMNDTDIQIINSINNDYFTACVDFINSIKHSIEDKFYNNYDTKYIYEFIENYNLLFELKNNIGNIELFNSILSIIDKIMFKDITIIRYMLLYKTKHFIELYDIENSYLSIEALIRNTRNTDIKVKELIELLLIKFGEKNLLEEDKKLYFQHQLETYI